MEYEIEIYQTDTGKRPFFDWLEDLNDKVVLHKIQAKLDRLRLGNLGNCKAIRAGLYEFKLDFGPGYRIYFTFSGTHIVLLLCGGTKRTQQKDIEKAKLYLANFKIRGK